MTGERREGPGPAYWIGSGVFIGVLSLILLAAGYDFGKAGLIAAGAFILYGVVVKAIAAGIRSSRED